MVKLLTLDQSSSAIGWCVGEVQRPYRLTYGSWRPPFRDLPGKRNNTVLRWLRELIQGNGVDTIAYEQPLPPGGVTSTYDTLLSLYGLVTVIGMAADAETIEADPVPMGTWRSAFGVPLRIKSKLGEPEMTQYQKTKELKLATMRRCIMLGFPVDNDNAGDAIGIWHFQAAFLAARGEQKDFFAEVTL